MIEGAIDFFSNEQADALGGDLLVAYSTKVIGLMVKEDVKTKR